MTKEEFLVKILLHSFRQGQLAAFGLFAQNISGRDKRKAAIDGMFNETMAENSRNARGMLALFRRQFKEDCDENTERSTSVGESQASGTANIR